MIEQVDFLVYARYSLIVVIGRAYPAFLGEPNRRLDRVGVVYHAEFPGEVTSRCEDRPRPSVVDHLALRSSVFNPECRTVLRLALAPIVEAGGRYIRVSQALLHLGDIGIVR
jgi:hypothetical protein